MDEPEREINETLYQRFKKKLKHVFQSSLMGLLFSAISGICFTMSNFMVQVTTITFNQTTSSKISSLQMVIARCLVQLLFVIPFVVLFKVKLYEKLTDVIFILPMGISGFMNIVFIYLSLERIPISDTLLITFTSPFFCALLSKLILREGLHWINWLAGTLSFIGVAVVARPSFIFGDNGKPRETLTDVKHPAESQKIYLIGVFYALLGAIFLALYFVLVRRLVNHSKVHIIMTFFYPSLFGTLFVYLMMLAERRVIVLPRDFTDFIFMASIGVYSIIALVFLTLALKMQNATVVNLIRNLDVIYAFSLQYAVFDIKPNQWNISGGLIIVGATTIVVIRQYYDFKKLKLKYEQIPIGQNIEAEIQRE